MEDCKSEEILSERSEPYDCKFCYIWINKAKQQDFEKQLDTSSEHAVVADTALFFANLQLGMTDIAIGLARSISA